MKGLDTNALVRLIVKDDAKQWARIDRVVGEGASKGEQFHVGVIVLCELSWVLASRYAESQERIREAIEVLLDAPEMVVEDADLVRHALRDAEKHGIELPDALIGRRNRRAGCDVTLTFDRRLARCDGFRAP